jgi:proteasome lid subunit RPN8/RPN11
MDLEGKSETPGRRVKFIQNPAPVKPALPGTPALNQERPNKVRFLEEPAVTARAATRSTANVSAAGSEPSHCATVPEVVYALPDGTSVRVTVSEPACTGLAVHCAESCAHGREVGGVLVGYQALGQPAAGAPEHVVLVTNLIPIQAGSSSGSHVRFDETDWEYVDRQMESLYAGEGKCRIGWYHTHPTQGIFFSNYDHDAHSVFQQPFQFALVVDPRVMVAGLFYWKDHAARQLGGPIRFQLQNPGAVVGRRRSSEWPRVAVLITAAVATTGSVMVWAPGWSLVPLAISTLGVAGWVGLRSWNPGVLHMLAGGWERGMAVILPMLALLVFSAGMRNGQLRQERQYLVQAQQRQTAGTPGLSRPVTAGTAPTAVGQVAPAPASDILPPSGPRPRVRLVVLESARGRSSRVLLVSGERQVSINYRLQDCRQFGPKMDPRACRIVVDPRKEQIFLRTVFAPKAERGVWQSLQRSLGMEGRQVDGLWGRITRTRFLKAAVSPSRTGPLRIDLPKVGPADVIFEPPGRKKARV